MERIIIRCRNCGLSKRTTPEKYNAVVIAHAVTEPTHTTYLVSYETGKEL